MFESLKITGEKLYDEYKKYGNLIVAVDFDGTIHQYSEKEKLEDIEPIVEIIKKVQDYSTIVIYTVSSEDRFEYILNHCKKLGIRVDAINNLPASVRDKVPHKEFSETNRSKLFYNIFLDNRAGLEESYKALTQFYFLLVFKDTSIYEKIRQEIKISKGLLGTMDIIIYYDNILDEILHAQKTNITKPRAMKLIEVSDIKQCVIDIGTLLGNLVEEFTPKYKGEMDDAKMDNAIIDFNNYFASHNPHLYCERGKGLNEVILHYRNIYY